MTDLKYYLLPDKLMYPLLAMAILALLLKNTPQGCAAHPWGVLEGGFAMCTIINHLLSGLAAAGFFTLLIIISRGKGMGWGDVMYGLFLGILLGHPGTIVALYIAFLTGALVSVILLVARKKKFGQIIPFGPFLVLGTVISLYYSDYIWNIFF